MLEDLLNPEKPVRTAGWLTGLTAKAIGLLVNDLHVVLRVAICDLMLTLLCNMAALQPTVRNGLVHLLELSLWPCLLSTAAAAVLVLSPKSATSLKKKRLEP